MKHFFIKISILSILLLALASCDKDFNSLGSDIIEDQHFGLKKYIVNNLNAYTMPTGAVQSNNLPLNQLGIYKHPYFGKTVASFVSQVELANINPSVGYNAEVDSVYLYVPYFSTLTGTEEDERIYELDSVFGDANAKFKLSVYENNFAIEDFEASNPIISQKYYTDQQPDIDAVAGTELLNNSSNTSQNTEFYFSNNEIIIYKTDGNGVYVNAQGEPLSDQNDPSIRVKKERKTPGIWLDLKKEFFKQKVIDAYETGELFNNNIFKNHFKGLYFKVEENVTDQGALAMLDFSKAELKIIYKAASVLPTTELPNPAKSRRVLSLQMGYTATGNKKSNSINFLNNYFNTDYNTAINSGNPLLGDEKIYLKGGNGSVAFIDLFGADVNTNGTPDELEILRTNNWLINDAILTFYVDAATMSNELNPLRIYIFDATNNNPIFDYTLDNSTNANPKFNKLGFGGFLIEDSNSAPLKYTIRLTEHINRIIHGTDQDTNKNIRIGVCVTENINQADNAFIKPSNIINIGSDEVKYIPVSNVLSPMGVVLYGSHSNVPNNKKLKLEIFFSEPN